MKRGRNKRAKRQSRRGKRAHRQLVELLDAADAERRRAELLYREWAELDDEAKKNSGRVTFNGVPVFWDYELRGEQ